MVLTVKQDSGVLPAVRSVAALGAMGWLAVAGGSSLGAGAIHAAAIGVHAEHRQAVAAFTVVAAIQLGWGAILLARPGRLLIALGVVANVAIAGMWLLAKTSGIGFVEGLGEVEPVQFADSMAAALAIAAALGGLFHLFGIGSRTLAGSPLATGTVAILLAGLSLPGMLAAGSHAHATGAAGHGAQGAATGGAGHDAHGAATGGAGHEAHGATSVPPKVFDPLLPIDLSGLDGVSPQQQARAENLLAISLYELPQFSDPAALGAMGFVSIGDGFTGVEHYLNAANMNDDRILDPDYPESLVFDTTTTPKRLAAAMFMMNPGDKLADVPDVGGALTQWHIHNNLCFSGPQVAGITNEAGVCPGNLTKGSETPMMHVWIQKHPCGPFAALEGIGAGQVAEGETKACDAAHGSH